MPAGKHRQCDEDERRTAVGVDANGECGRENHKAGKDGDEGVDGDEVGSGAHQIGLAREVRSEGAETTHTDGQRIERLTHGGEEHAAVHLGEVGTEKKLDAFGRTGQHTRADYDDEEEDEERWHHSL